MNQTILSKNILKMSQKPIKNSSSESQHLKCGEIYFVANNFSFLCITCEFEIESFLEFKLHFQNLHINDFVCEPKEENVKEFTSLLENEALQNVEQKRTSNEEYIDPLNWFCEHKHDCEKATLIENTGILSNDLNLLTTSPTGVDVHAESIKKDQQLDYESDNADKSCNSSNIGDHVSSIDYNVDWDKPFKPTQGLVKRPYKKRDQPNACTYCGRTFRRRYQLDTHLNIHTGAKPHQCDICGRRFRALTTLQRHLITHEKRKDHICQFCDKSFTHRAALLSHESRHVQKRSVSCDYCEKIFYTVNQCDTHMRRVHHKSNKALPSLPYACDICPNRYRSASMLSTHKFRKHLKTAKFMCDKCDKRFVDQQKFNEHQNIHVNKVEGT